MYLDKKKRSRYDKYILKECIGARRHIVARNKYPEITVEKILEVAQRLFFRKGI